MLLHGTIDTVYKGPMETPVNSTVALYKPMYTRGTQGWVNHFRDQLHLTINHGFNHFLHPMVKELKATIKP